MNKKSNRTTGSYLNYGFHALNLIQILSSTSDTANEAVLRYVSRVQVDFRAALENLKKATDKMRAKNNPTGDNWNSTEETWCFSILAFYIFEDARKSFSIALWGPSQ